MSISGSGSVSGAQEEQSASAPGKSVSKWRVFCYDEPAPLDEPDAPGNWTEGWWPTKPDFCFNDRHNHRINKRSVQWMETISEQGPITIREEEVPPGKKPGGGRIKATAPMFHPLGNEPGDFTIYPGVNVMYLVKPYPIYIYGISTNTSLDQRGDRFDVCVAPDSPVGFLVADVTAGSDILYVSPTVFEHVYVSLNIALNDMGPPGQVSGVSLGEIYEIDKEAGTIKVSKPATRDFSSTTPPSFVQVTACPIEEYYIGFPGAQTVGLFKTGGTRVEEGYPVKVIYTRNKDTPLLGGIPIPMERTS